MENYVFTNPYLHWVLFAIGALVVSIPLPMIVIASEGWGVAFFIYAVCFVISLIWPSFFVIPTFLSVMLLFLVFGLLVSVFDAKREKNNLLISRLILVGPLLFCGVYTINAFFVADQQEVETNTIIRAAKEKEMLFKKDTEERAVCKSLNFEKYKADGGDTGKLMACKKLLAEPPPALNPKTPSTPNNK